jgi:hypothetical protein
MVCFISSPQRWLPNPFKDLHFLSGVSLLPPAQDFALGDNEAIMSRDELDTLHQCHPVDVRRQLCRSLATLISLPWSLHIAFSIIHFSQSA